MTGLTVDAVTAGYGTTRIVNNVSLIMGAGDVVALLGASGSGKTTLLRAVVGQADIMAGTITAGGTVAVVAQHTMVGSHYPATAADIVQLGDLRRSRSRRQRQHHAQQLLADVGDINPDVRWQNLSGGQQQRVLLARALAGDPDVLLCDEPTSSLDVEARNHIVQLLETQAAAGRTVLLVTHDLQVAQQLPRVLCLNRTVVADGPPQQVLDRQTLERTYGHTPTTENPK